MRPWSFWRAIPFVLLAMLLFELAETLYWRITHGEANTVVWIASAAFVSSSVFSFLLWRKEILEFFRSVQVGIVVLVFATIACTVGVLVPQIDDFEDPDERVTAQNYESNYSAFKWAVGYFGYHMTHLYGAGMPQTDVPPQAKAGVERLGKKYGKELADNRLKEMQQAFRSNAKNEEIREHILKNESLYKSLFDICTTLDFNRAYKSGWFLAIMSLIFGCVLSNLFRFGVGPIFTWQRCGFATAHVGVLTILVGGALSKAYSVRGIVHMHIEDSSSEYLAYFNRNKPRKLPFQLRLEDFKRDDWDKLEVHFLDEKFASRPPRYTIWKDYQLPLDYDEAGEPRYSVRIKERYPRVKVSDPQLEDVFDEKVPVAKQVWDPAIEINLEPAASDDSEGRMHSYLFGSGESSRSLLLHPQNKWRMRYVWAQTATEIQKITSEPIEERIGSLIMQVGKDPNQKPVHFYVKQIGDVFDLDDYSVEVTHAVGHFMMEHNSETGRKEPRADSTPLSKQALSSMPAIQVRIRNKKTNETEERWVLHRVDAEEFGFQKKYKFKDLYTNMGWDYWRSPVAKRFWLTDTPETGLQLLAADGSQSPVAVAPGKPIAMFDHSNLTVLHHARRAYFRYDFEPIAEENFFHRDPAGIVLEVTTPHGVETHRLASTDGADRVVIDGKLGVIFLEDTETLPFEWRSKLSALELDLDGKPQLKERGEIRVNDYFSYRGYHFFQTNAVVEDPEYSGIGVVYDPGMTVVVLGMYIVMGGVAFALFRRLVVQGGSL